MSVIGSKNSNSYDGRYYTFNYTSYPNVSKNTSTVNWSLSANGGSSAWYAERTCKVLINNTAVYSKTERVQRYTGTIASGTKTITHKSDGTGSFTFAVQVAVYGSSVNITIPTTTVTLDKINRSTIPTLSASTANIGDTITINTPRASTSITHKLSYKIGTTTTVIASNVENSYRWTLPSSLASKITTSKSATVVIICDTYNGSDLVGSNSVNLKATVPNTDTYKPSISVAHEETVASVKSAFNSYTKGLSKVKVTISASAKSGAKISSYSTSFNGATYTKSSFTSGVLASSGTVPIKVKVVDSRGYSTSTTVNITVKDYTKPTISALKVTRCNANGSANNEGAYAKLTFKASVCSISGNTATYTIKYKKTTSSSYTTVPYSATALAVDTYQVIANIDPDYAYDFSFKVQDKIGSTTQIKSLGSAFVLMDFGSGGRSLALGKVSENNGFELALPMVISYGKHFYTVGPDGSLVEVFCAKSSYGNLVIGNGLYDAKSGSTHIYGNDVRYYVANQKTPGSIKPYWTIGDTINVDLLTAGYTSTNATKIYFNIPLNRPILSHNALSFSYGTDQGFILRQSDKYTHGSASETYVTPSSITYTVTSSGIKVVATMSSTTNAVNNSAIGIVFKCSITLS